MICSIVILPITIHKIRKSFEIHDRDLLIFSVSNPSVATKILDSLHKPDDNPTLLVFGEFFCNFTMHVLMNKY